jgi:type II secretory pathway component PulF
LQRDRRHLAAAAPVPASAIVWWRAQRRAREEAARTAGRPITIVQSAGLVCGAMAVIAVLAGTLPIFARWFDGLGQLLPTADAAMSSGSAAPSMMSWVWPLALGAGLVLASVAVYFAVREEP